MPHEHDRGVLPSDAELPLWSSTAVERCVSGFPHDRTRFLGGADDEIVLTPTFVGLACALGNTIPFFYQLLLAKGYKRTQDLSMPKALDFVDSTLAEYGRRHVEALESGRPPVRAEKPAGKGAEALQSLDWFSPDARYAARREERRTGRVAAKDHETTWAKGVRRPEDVPEGLVRASMRPKDVQYDVYVPVGDIVQLYLSSPWLGILYIDQLRSRPVGPVLGRLLYTMALAPGEEATLQQKSWTKRETLFEEIREREEEQSLEYDSTWSTSFKSQFDEEWSRKLTSQLTSNLGGEYKGISAEVGSSLSAEAGYRRTASRQATSNRTLSQKAALRAKERHQTTFKVTTERGEEFASKRILRNTNPDRALELQFYKVLQKHRLLLERHDALMTLKLCLPDPVGLLRAAVLAELEKLDPVIDPAEGPQMASVDWSRTIEATQYAGGGWEPGNETNVARYTVDIPANYRLSTLTGPNFVRARNENGDVVYDGDPDAFHDDGGGLGFTVVPPIGAEGRIEFEVSVTYPEPSWWINGTDVAEVEYTIELGATLTAQFTDDFRQRREEWEAGERERIRATFSLERLRAMTTERAVHDYARAQVVERFLLSGYFAADVEPPCATAAAVDDWFAWDRVQLEFLPWWVTPNGRENRAALDEKIGAMPPEVIDAIAARDFLASPMAIVYLPMRPGREVTALRHLLNAPFGSSLDERIRACVSGFEEFREERFPPVDREPSSMDDVVSPAVESGTPLGSDDWEHDWERPDHVFTVLAEWSETLPTDGVHLEAVLAACDGVSELRRVQLLSEVREREADAAAAEADALTKLAALPDHDSAGDGAGGADGADGTDVGARDGSG